MPTPDEIDARAVAIYRELLADTTVFAHPEQVFNDLVARIRAASARRHASENPPESVDPG